MFTGISNIEEVAFNALSFVWNPTEEAKVSTSSSSPKDTCGCFVIFFISRLSPCRFSQERRRNKWKVLKRKDRKGRGGRWRREGAAGEGGGGIPEMCLAPRLLSPWQERSLRGLLVWLRGVEVGPPNLLQVQGDGVGGGWRIMVVGIKIWKYEEGDCDQGIRTRTFC